MKIGFNISPLQTGHAVRGVGTYTKNLKEALVKYYPSNEYLFVESNTFVNAELDVLHYPFFDPFFITLPIRKKTKIVVTIHDLIPLLFPEHFPSGIKGLIKWNVQKLLLNRIDAIITDSGSSKNDIIRLTGINKDKVHVVYLAPGEEFRVINKKEDLERVKKKYNLPSKFLLYVGDATWNKNLPRILESVEQVGIPLILIGKSLENKLIDVNNTWNSDLVYVQKHIDGKTVRVLGFVPTEDLVTIYNLAQVLIMPSLYEGFGLPVLEAMSCGCPVITAKNSSLGEIGGDAVVYVDPYNVKDIIRGINTLAKDPNARESLVKRGLGWVGRFTWKSTVEETVKVYEKIYK